MKREKCYIVHPPATWGELLDVDETVDLLDFDNINDVDVNVEQGHVLPWQVGRGASV